jgi:lipoyl(octanoyl) transferase
MKIMMTISCQLRTNSNSSSSSSSSFSSPRSRGRSRVLSSSRADDLFDLNVRHVREIKLYDFSAEVVPYDVALDMQKRILAKQLDVKDCDSNEKNLFECDAVILLQHANVITLGTGSTVDNLKFDPARDVPKDFEFRRCERGGEATVHLPGQLVLYPILRLDIKKGESFKPDLHEYMRNLEEVALRVAKNFGVLNVRREPGVTGAWANGSKFAQVGVRARRWVTYHGLAINVNCDLHEFTKHVIPCGIKNKPVASIQGLLRSQNIYSENEEEVSTTDANARDDINNNNNNNNNKDGVDISIELASKEIIRAFESVFDVSLVQSIYSASG